MRNISFCQALLDKQCPVMPSNASNLYTAMPSAVYPLSYINNYFFSCLKFFSFSECLYFFIFRISSARFAELVQAIQYLFPEEDSVRLHFQQAFITKHVISFLLLRAFCINVDFLLWQELYLIPYKNCDGKKFVAKGKLVTKYYSIRKEFKALGIITQNKDESGSEDDLEGQLCRFYLHFFLQWEQSYRKRIYIHMFGANFTPCLYFCSLFNGSLFFYFCTLFYDLFCQCMMIYRPSFSSLRKTLSPGPQQSNIGLTLLNIELQSYI